MTNMNLSSIVDTVDILNSDQELSLSAGGEHSVTKVVVESQIRARCFLASQIIYKPTDLSQRV